MFDDVTSILVFIGYSPMHIKKLVCAANDAQTVSLGNVYIEEATYSLPDASLSKWQEELAELVQSSSVPTS